MDRQLQLNALALCALLTLAACGGRLDDAPQPAAPAQAGAAAPSAATATAAAIGPVEGGAGSAPVIAEDPILRLSREVAQLRHEVSDLRQQVARGPNAAPPAAAAAPADRSDPQARAEAARSEQQRIASSEQAFRSQPVDARWSQGATASVRAALGDVDEGLRNQVRSVECRAQSCRVEISADGNGTAMRDLPMLVNRLGGSLPNVTAGQIDQGDGRQATVLYLSAK
jgi:hypothetical protein